MTKKEKIQMIAETWTDEADILALTELFYEQQCKYLETLSDEDLEYEYQDVLKDNEALLDRE